MANAATACRPSGQGAALPGEGCREALTSVPSLGADVLFCLGFLGGMGVGFLFPARPQPPPYSLPPWNYIPGSRREGNAMSFCPPAHLLVSEVTGSISSGMSFYTASCLTVRVCVS